MSEAYFYISHRADHLYLEPVESAYGRLLLIPRAGGGQRVHAASVEIAPEPDRRHSRRDFHGNTSMFVQLTQAHDRLLITAKSVIEVTRKPVNPTALPRIGWENAAQAVRTVLNSDSIAHAGSLNAALAVAESRLASPLVSPCEEVREFTAPSFRPGRPLADVVLELAARVASAVRIRPGRTERGGALAALQSGEGSRDDAAHLLIAAVRSMGLAARYLTGYRYDPSLESGALHSWVSIWIPGGGWLHVDPSLGAPVDHHYVVLGWGRDARDVLPIRGVAYGASLRSAPETTVRMRGLSREQASELAVGVRAGTRNG